MITVTQANKICSAAHTRKFFGVLILLMACLANARAQKSNGPSRLLTQLPFTTFTGGVVVIRAQLVGYPDTLNFIMDTGSSGISLDSLTCIRLNIKPALTDRLITGIGGVRQLKYVNDQSLIFGNIKVDSLNFHVSDYEVLSSVYGDRIDGIIGFSFFSRYIVRIDYDSSQLYVYSKGNYKYPRGGYMLRPLLVGIPIESAGVKDTKDIDARFYFDTGAGLCLLLNSDFIRDSALLNADKKPLPTQAQGMGGKAIMMETTMKEFKLGPYRFKNVPTHIFDDDYNVTDAPYLAGLIGNDILRRFNVILNYDKKQIYLLPNSHYRDQFDYSYTGLGLYWIEGEIRVGDVMKDSPAEKAGFKIDDIVIAVNNNMSQNLQAYKSMLQNTGDKVRVLINRPSSGVQELSLRVKSVL